MFRGSIMDIFTIIAVLFIFTFSMLIGSAMLTQAGENFDTIDDDYGDITTYYFAKGQTSFNIMDTLTIFIFFGLGIAMLVSAFFIKTHPIFFVVSLILLTFVLLFSAVISNSYQEMGESDALSVEANKYTLTSTVMNNLPTLVLILSALVLIVMFGKSYSGGVSEV